MAEIKYQKWEYLIENNLGKYNLNLLGKEGWELVSTIPIFRDTGDTVKGIQFFFKRPLLK